MQGISDVHVQESEVGEAYPSPKEVKMRDLPGPGGRTFGAQYHDYSESRGRGAARGGKSRGGSADKSPGEDGTRAQGCLRLPGSATYRSLPTCEGNHGSVETSPVHGAPLCTSFSI